MPVDDKDVMEHFILEHAPLLSRVVNRLKNQGMIHSNVDESGLREHGLVGLFKAARSYDRASQRSFKNHALESIYTHMRDYLSEQDPIHPSLRRKSRPSAQPKMEQPKVPAATPTAVPGVPKPEGSES